MPQSPAFSGRKNSSSQQAVFIIIGINLYTFGVAHGSPIISNFNIYRPMALHDKNGINNHKFNIRGPQSFSEIGTAVHYYNNNGPDRA